MYAPDSGTNSNDNSKPATSSTNPESILENSEYNSKPTSGETGPSEFNSKPVSSNQSTSETKPQTGVTENSDSIPQIELQKDLVVSDGNGVSRETNNENLSPPEDINQNNGERPTTSDSVAKVSFGLSFVNPVGTEDLEETSTIGKMNQSTMDSNPDESIITSNIEQPKGNNQTEINTIISSDPNKTEDLLSTKESKEDRTDLDNDNASDTSDYNPDSGKMRKDTGERWNSVIRSDLRNWKNKKYFGGYRVKKTGKEFFHAEAQTTTPQDIQVMNRGERFHRDTQTVDTHNNRTQTVAEVGTQMTKSGCYVGKGKDYRIKVRKYTTAAQLHETKMQCATVIQCFFRKIQAERKTRQLRLERDLKLKAAKEKEQRRQNLIEKKRVMENERRLHPKTEKDFEILYSGLEHWRTHETNRINKLKLIEPARLAALADLLDQESALLQKIDKLKIDATIENREKSIYKLLEKMSSPKKWLCRDNKLVQVDTPNIIRARELRDLYHALNFPMLTVDERLQILLHVKFTVKEFDCNLTRDIVDLIDREGDLISRGRGEKSLEGLRKRICNLFLQFIQTPEFNPEVTSHTKLLNITDEPWKAAAVYYCRGCTKYKSSTEFYLSTTLKHLGKCKECSLKENLAIQKTDDSCYGTMLKQIRLQESQKRKMLNKTEDTFHAMALLQESDIRYLVDIIWNKKSVISGHRLIEDLILTRWDINQELSPWNCILLTKMEAATHDCQKSPDAVYSIEFRNKVFHKLLLARQHFGQLPSMAKYLSEHYLENSEGRLVHKSILK